MPVRSIHRIHLCLTTLLSFALLSLVGQPAAAVTDEDVDRAIEAAKKALLNRQKDTWAIRVYKRERRKKLKKVNEGGRTVEKMVMEQWSEVPADVFFGEPIQDLPGGGVAFRTMKQGAIEVAKERIAYLVPPGHFHPERESTKQGGASCLAVLALLEAGVSPQNPQIRAALQWLERYPLKMTYSRALRANLYTVLISKLHDRRERSHFRRLLDEDIRWLERAMSEDGWYHYGAKAAKGKGDHSCSQFGVLGAWAGANAGIEIPQGYWRVVADHWLRHQGLNGGWGYHGRPPDVPPQRRPGDAPLRTLATATMTTAGVNTLYVVLDTLYSRLERPYRWLRGVEPDPRTRDEVNAIYTAIDGGLKWMAKHKAATAKSGWTGYQEFGMERLGVASGLKYIGKVDWYAANVKRLIKHKWTGEPVADGFYLLFLVYGRAPIVFNKLQWGKPEQWNYYFRDLHYACRFLNAEVERIHKWQIVTLASPLHDLLDAPILYVCGNEAFTASPDERKKLRDYCEAGGTIVAHPNLADDDFAASFKKQMVDLFQDREYTFKTLDKDHPVYTTHFGKGTNRRNRFRKTIPLEGMSDGGRTFIFVIGGDIAGALHQNRSITYADAFKLMANLRFYSGPGYEQLPGRLRPKGLPGKPAELKGTLKVGRLIHAGNWDTNPTAWPRFGKLLRHVYGVAVEETKGVDPTNAAKLSGFHILHLTGYGELKLDEAALAALKQYVEGGGLLLIDACGGDQAFATSAGALVDAMYPDKSELIPSSHPIVQGGPGGSPELTKLWPTAASSSRLRGRKAPPFISVTIDGRSAILFAPFDLTASMDGHYIYEKHGYRNESARRIMRNVLLWRFEQVK